MAIETVGLTKHYGPTVAVSDLNLRVRQGELYGLLGPNGAGKTTTMRILCGILRPTRGTARILGKDIVGEALEVKRLIGYVPESPNPYEYLTVDEFLTFMGELHDVTGRALRDRVDRYLEMLELADKRRSLISTLSRGMRQKVALIAALVHEPKVLLLDEPLMGLDPGVQRTVKDMLYERVNDGATVLFSTHIMDWAEAMCTRIGIINRGQLVAEGTMDELRAMSRSGRHATLEDVFIKLTEEGMEALV